MPGRNISDNILLAQELVHDINIKRRGGNVVIKLDMTKAYDRLEWCFLYEVLRRMGFSEQWIWLVKNCIEGCYFSVLANDEVSGFFKSNRGLQQGDPMSPFLFVVSAEYLSKSLQKMVENYPRMAYSTRWGLPIRHFLYADDTIIFILAWLRGIEKLMHALCYYEKLSGQKVNTGKTSFIVSKSTSSLSVQRIRNPTEFRMKHLPITYLGAPLYVGVKKASLFDSPFQSLTACIKGWEKAVLSFGGRLQLIKSVLLAMPIYLLQVVKPPKAVTTRIERMLN